MVENLQAAFERYGSLTIRDLALEVAFTAEPWWDICEQAEAIGAAKPGSYRRLLNKAGGHMELMQICVDALFDVDGSSDGGDDG